MCSVLYRNVISQPVTWSVAGKWMWALVAPTCLSDGMAGGGPSGTSPGMSDGGGKGLERMENVPRPTNTRPLDRLRHPTALSRLAAEQVVSRDKWGLSPKSTQQSGHPVPAHHHFAAAL